MNVSRGDRGNGWEYRVTMCRQGKVKVALLVVVSVVALAAALAYFNRRDDDPLAGRWSNSNGSYEFVKSDEGYEVKEYGALGEVGNGTATLSEDTVTMNASNAFVGPYTIRFTLNDNTLQSSLNVMGVAMPFVLTRDSTFGLLGQLDSWLLPLIIGVALLSSVAGFLWWVLVIWLAARAASQHANELDRLLKALGQGIRAAAQNPSGAQIHSADIMNKWSQAQRELDHLSALQRERSELTMSSMKSDAASVGIFL